MHIKKTDKAAQQAWQGWVSFTKAMTVATGGSVLLLILLALIFT
jgi:hypothetical protein